MTFRLIVLDTETTGVEDPIGVCELAFIELDPITLTEVGRFRSLVDPQLPISAAASGVHRITNAMVADEPTLDECFDIVLKNPFANDDVVMVAHNAPFDYKLVKRYLGTSRKLCTLRLIRKVLPDAENHKLATLKFLLGLGRNDGHSHSALDDVEDTADLLRYIVAQTGLTILELLDLQDQPTEVKTMPFSAKYKGQPLKDVPASFWRWLQRQPGEGVDRDLAHSVKLLHPNITLKEKTDD